MEQRLRKREAMSSEINAKTDPNEPRVYEIRVKGHLDEGWTDWFEGMTVTPTEDGETLLSGPVADQAALHGLLRKVRDLGLPLISVTRVECGEGDGSYAERQIAPSCSGMEEQNEPG
jgi:hypothetical protein